MKALLLLFVPCLCLAQSYNSNIATTSGNWNVCTTWNNPLKIYNSSNSEKVISNNVAVAENISYVAAKKITFLGNGRIDFIGSNRISFFESFPNEDVTCDTTDSLIDKVTVNLAQPVMAKSLSGFLGGLSASTSVPDRDKVRELKPKLFRTSHRDQYQESYDIAGRVHYTTNNVWANTWDPVDGLYNIQKDKPYEEQSYIDYLEALFEWGYSNGSIKPGIVWECWNEPEPPNIYSNWLYEDFYETYRVFYQTLRDSALGDTALAAGPSYASFTEQKMKNFFDYCLANNLEVNVVTWHEASNPDQDYKPFPLLKAHVEYVRDNFMNNPKYASLEIQSIEINEMIWGGDKNRPVEIAGHLRNLEDAGIDYACKTGWLHIANTNAQGSLETVECGNPDVKLYSSEDTSLDDLFTIDYDSQHYINNSNDCQPSNNGGEVKSGWWVYKLYSDGVDYRVKSYNEQAWSTVISSCKIQPYLQTTPSVTAQVLFGYTQFYPAPYIAASGTYKMRINDVKYMVTTTDTCYVKILRIPFNAADSFNGYEDNTPLSNPEPFIASTQYDIVNNGIDLIIHDIEPEHLYQILISASQF